MIVFCEMGTPSIRMEALIQTVEDPLTFICAPFTPIAWPCEMLRL